MSSAFSWMRTVSRSSRPSVFPFNITTSTETAFMSLTILIPWNMSCRPALKYYQPNCDDLVAKTWEIIFASLSLEAMSEWMRLLETKHCREVQWYNLEEKRGSLHGNPRQDPYISSQVRLGKGSLSPASLRQGQLKRDGYLFQILRLALQNSDFAGKILLEQSLSSLAFPLSASFRLLRSFE